MTAPSPAHGSARLLFARKERGVTLLELLTVILIIGILAALLLPSIGWYRARAYRIGCVQNLKSLYVATTNYLASNGGVWPQIPLAKDQSVKYAEAWEEALRPHGITWQNFACPMVQTRVGNPDVSQPKSHRTDYIAMPFSATPNVAMKWPLQPWFAERQDAHGSGGLIILTNSQIIDLKEAAKMASQPQQMQ